MTAPWSFDSATVTFDSSLYTMDGGGPASLYVTLGQAVSDLVNAGFVVTQQIGQWNSTVPAGYAITTSPAPGTVVPYGTKLVLYYSLGPAPVQPSTVTVPVVIGMSYAAACETLAQIAGVGLANPAYQQSSAYGAGTVLNQSAEGAVAYGTLVTLTVAATAVSYVATGTQTVISPL